MGKKRNKNSSEIADIWQLIYFLAYHFFSVLKNFWLCWVFTARWFSSSCGEWGLLSNCGVRASHCSFCSCFRLQALGCAGFNSCGSWALEHRLNIVAHRLSCSVACGIFLYQGLNCLLNWQVDSLLFWATRETMVYHFSVNQFYT